MQLTIIRYDRARDKTGLNCYVCFFALLVDSGFFEGVKKVLHVGEVGLFRYFRVNDIKPSCVQRCSISTSVTSFFLFSFSVRSKKNWWIHILHLALLEER